MSASRVAQEWAKGWPKLAQIQKQCQTAPGYIHRKFGDKTSSYFIPLGTSLVATVFMVPGLFNMYLGRGRLE